MDDFESKSDDVNKYCLTIKADLSWDVSTLK